MAKVGKIINYFFKFSTNNFELNDLLFENVAKDINDVVKELDSYIIIALEHACPFGLYFSYNYPFRFYSKGSFNRRFWKLKENGGYATIIKNYDVDKYLININNTRLQELIEDETDNGNIALWHVIDFYMQKQHNKIPSVFKVPTVLYTRLDLDVESIVEHNYNRTDIASMKKIFSENDALQQSMVWNFERVKYDAMLKSKNKKSLKIKYLVSGWEDIVDVYDEVILFIGLNTKN